MFVARPSCNPCSYAVGSALIIAVGLAKLGVENFSVSIEMGFQEIVGHLH